VGLGSEKTSNGQKLQNLDRKSLDKRPLGRPRSRVDDDIKVNVCVAGSEDRYFVNSYEV
jgi:hypothetical protein